MILYILMFFKTLILVYIVSVVSGLAFAVSVKKEGFLRNSYRLPLVPFLNKDKHSGTHIFFYFFHFWQISYILLFHKRYNLTLALHFVSGKY